MFDGLKKKKQSGHSNRGVRCFKKVRPPLETLRDHRHEYSPSWTEHNSSDGRGTRRFTNLQGHLTTTVRHLLRLLHRACEESAE